MASNSTFRIITLLLQLAAESFNALASKGVIKPQVGNIVSGISLLVLQELAQFQQPTPVEVTPVSTVDTVEVKS